MAIFRPLPAKRSSINLQQLGQAIISAPTESIITKPWTQPTSTPPHESRAKPIAWFPHKSRTKTSSKVRHPILRLEPRQLRALLEKSSRVLRPHLHRESASQTQSSSLLVTQSHGNNPKRSHHPRFLRCRKTHPILQGDRSLAQDRDGACREED